MLNHSDFWGPVSRVMCSSSNRRDLSGGGMGEDNLSQYGFAGERSETG